MSSNDRRCQAGNRCGVPRLGGLRVICAAALLTWLAGPLAGQGEGRMWAAQTGPDQVTLEWDSIPGTMEYRIYVGAVGGANPGQPPVQRLGGRTRRTMLFGIQRLASGISLVAVGSNGRVLRQAQFNQVVRATSFPPITAPAELTADATGTAEVTLSWTPVPGATAYFIGRAVSPGGLQVLCGLCSTEPRYVDRSAVAGFLHTYAISAIFPNGISRRVGSNQVTPGVTEVAATSGQQMPTVSDKVAPPLPTTTTPATTSPTTSSPATTSTSTQTTNNPISGVVGEVAGALGGLSSPLSPPTGVSASIAGPGAVRLTWQASPTSGVTEYRVNRRVNGGAWELLNTVGASTVAYSDAFFPITMFAAGPARVTYNVVASKSGAFSPAATTGELVVQPPTTSATPAPGTPVTPCRLDYQRADNMWAAFGRPDGPLGTESISLSPGQDKVFITDWKYEKQRNDGTNYYGSHLRIATNSTSRTIRLQLRSLTLTGLVVYARTGSDTFWIRLDPGKTQQFQADLMEVFCEN